MKTTSAALEDLIESTVSIPTIPATLMEINRIVASEDGSAREAGEVIERDPAIAAKVLRLVNSSFYALRNPINAIGLACSMLGLKVIKNIAVQASVLDSFGTVGGVSGFDPAWLWEHSFKAALAARRLAEALGPASGFEAADAYTAGLIHDVGTLVLADGHPQRLAAALAAARAAAIPLARAEERVFGFSHAQVGGLLAERWKLAPALQRAVRFHHDPAAEPEGGKHGLLIACANTLAHQATAGDHLGEVAPDAQLGQLGVAAGALAAIRDEIAAVTAES